MNIQERIKELKNNIPEDVELVAVSKTFSNDDIMEAYEAGQRVFGESRQQELSPKHEALPKDIKWHMIGNLQRNKVKYIAPFVEMIHSVDSARLLRRINREASKNDRVIDVLLQIKVADEKTKQGWERVDLEKFLSSDEMDELTNIRVRGLMGMATFTDDQEQIKSEFKELKKAFDEIKEHCKDVFGGNFDTLSMGMTSDYELAIDCGSNMIRVGSLIFGNR